ncbi:hypothetical protein PanWU01x14_359110 [Parasponia andersonii]|uniref:Uncharacterized protein n=1 Tax=Parasponia andersonii TaxID=3476 RepID=A0A2P5A825_PARAD|nr:hypothetical protein PanWU01x14_359110 [Parasponia andersonii]
MLGFGQRMCMSSNRPKFGTLVIGMKLWNVKAVRKSGNVLLDEFSLLILRGPDISGQLLVLNRRDAWYLRAMISVFNVIIMGTIFLAVGQEHGIPRPT